MNIKSIAVDTLTPYAQNARTHSGEQIEQIARSILEFGFLNPVIVDGKNGIIAGHGRVLAAQRLGMPEVPTLSAAHLSETQKRAYILADNKLALNAGWDDAILKSELLDLKEENVELSLLGFSSAELGNYFESESVEEEVDTSEQLGDIEFKIIVDCENETEQAALLEKLESEGFACRALMS